ncbi:MAG TPA: PstS family phosphate ABC transporter substrate-binding protein [Oligoflexus sp.]|uniref:PstS family phosphate ABC transporter substrate-binding protein n=1 Tax=Oligoflexus sp. TaxID=1971216 RepID=UPI002D4184DC|nr:PstS family phosphate ABC transporter substrate-binding protein [Oligoflexus sp.]HYX39998.1 PstS family phosphate ABC transporter substrate-binding protein [Oligoflexus sp.]
MKAHNLLLSLAVFTMGCHGFASDKGDKNLKGEVRLDGSSTVFPIAEAAAEEFQKLYPRVRVTVGMSGTGGGFKKFSVGEIDIATASRKMKPEEIKKAQDAKVEFSELPLATDGISVVVHPANKWANQLTLAQLKEIWQPGSRIATWKDINPAWPNEKIKLYGPGADSGTFDFFTEQVMGTARLSRNDYVASEDDNVLVTGVSKDKNAMAYFGYAYYEENQQSMNLVALAKGKDAVAPSPKSIEDGSYPLSRPLVVYVNTKAAQQRPELKLFVSFLLKNAAKLSKEVGYIPLKEAVYTDTLKKFEAATGGPAKQTH